MGSCCTQQKLARELDLSMQEDMPAEQAQSLWQLEFYKKPTPQGQKNMILNQHKLPNSPHVPKLEDIVEWLDEIPQIHDEEMLKLYLYMRKFDTNKIGRKKLNEYKRLPVCGPFMLVGEKEENEDGEEEVGEPYFYYGQFKNGLKHGYGKMLGEDGTLYEGFFEKGQIFKYGRSVWPPQDEEDVSEDEDNGYEAFEGYMNAEGEKHGAGKMTYCDHSVYTGQYKNDDKDGFGVEINMNGDKYEGPFVEGVKQGKGKMFFPDGSIYEGEFAEGLLCGNGKYMWEDGRMYDGEWKDSKMNGQGVYKWADGRRFEGKYISNQKEGYGEIYFNDGSKYEGNFKNNMRHDQNAKFTKTDGTVEQQVWVNDVKSMDDVDRVIENNQMYN